MLKGCQRVLYVALSFVVAICFPRPSKAAASKQEANQPSTQQRVPVPAPEANAEQDNDTITVKGCLAKTSKGFVLTDEVALQDYRIIAPISHLQRDIAAEVQITGLLDKSGDDVSIHMHGIKLIRRQGTRSPVLGVSGWSSYKSLEYGVAVQYPASFESGTDDPQKIDSDFVNPEGVVNLRTLEIPRSIYPNTAFAGGSFSVSVSDDISNAPTCNVFQEYGVKSLGSRTIHGIMYSEAGVGNVAGGTSYSEVYFHTYQNDSCYEVAVALASGNLNNYGEPCEVDYVNGEAVVDDLLAKVSFFTPTTKKTPLKDIHPAIPAVTSFESTPGNAYGVAAITAVTISWSTVGTDYVQINFNCVSGISVYASREIDCGGDYEGHNLTPKGSVSADFQNDNTSPIPVLLTLQPFSNGGGDPKWSKTVTVVVHPSGHSSR